MVDLSDKQLLLVDDDKDFCFLIRMMLKKTGVNLFFAYNGEEAIRFMESGEHPVDIVLLDIQMPLISGYTVLDILKTRYPLIPVLAVTAFGMLGEREKCLKLGFNEYLSKPFDEHELIAMILHLLNQKA